MLLIDIHEPKSIVEELEARIPIGVIRLKYGDYSFSDTVIERKSLSDFFSSLKSGRLLEQMENISRFYTTKYLLIEGFFNFSYVNNVEYLYDQLFFLSHNFELKTIFSKDEKQTAYFIKKLYFARNHSIPMSISKKDKIYYAAKFFDVSARKMEKLYSHFGSISNMMDTAKLKSAKINGVGKRTLQRIKIAVNSDI